MDRATRLPSATASRLLILAGLLAGFGVRLYRLGAESLWYDETVSVHLARLPLSEMLQRTAGDIHPPGYYAMLHLWQAVTQPALAHGLEFLFAWPSLVLGVLALPLLYSLGRRLFGERAGVAALWLAAFHPFLIWYSQEVRMYTLGAALGLLCLWAVLKFAAAPAPGSRSTTRAAIGWLAVYVVSAAAGLYVLYYFLFLLVALNLIALAFIWLHENNAVQRGRQTWLWLLAQAAVLLLWSPWLPVFWRQATDPPVPPWRSPWDSAAALLHSAEETLAALLVGQSPPGAETGMWAIATLLLLVGLFALAVERSRRQSTTAGRRRIWLHVATVLLYVFVPIGILYAATLLGTPIYHVRYLALYAPLFVLIPAWLLVWAWRLHPGLGAALWGGLLMASGLALLSFWTDPLYRADDHRAAVAELARAWRPGDTILVNAGWVYPVLTTYWPGETTPGAPLRGEASAPPPLGQSVRLLDVPLQAPALALSAPQIVRSGSVDGSPALGWAARDSDFFAISREDTLAALDTLVGQARRIWHYRLYDTVSDPDGVIRTYLNEHGRLLQETPIPGRDYGLVQLYAPAAAPAVTAPVAVAAPPPAVFGEALALVQVTAPPTITAGSYLYVDLLWQALPPLAALPADLSLSLRLYDSAGVQVAQADGPPDVTPTRAWTAGETRQQIAAIPIRANTPPGSYSLQVIAYRQDDAQALPVGPNASGAWEISKVEITPPNP